MLVARLSSLALLLSLPSVALARDQVLDLGLGIGYACAVDDRRYHGAGAEVDVVYRFTDLWAVRGLFGHGEHVAKGQSFRVERLAVAGRFQLDVSEHVPWLEFAPTLFLSSGEVGPADGALGLAVGAGFDWLLSPDWTVGAGGAYHQVFGDALFPAYVTGGLRLGYRWTLGDPFAP